jgi:hypothetical protein
MTDWQLERLAGEAMGMTLDGVEGRDAFLWESESGEPWCPMSSPDQAMHLVMTFGLCIEHVPERRRGKRKAWIAQDNAYSVLVEDDELGRAIVRCVATLEQARAKR